MCRFKPINTSLYLCDNKFHTEALDELLEDDDKFGFIVMDGNGSLYGTLQGNNREVLHKFSVDLPKKYALCKAFFMTHWLVIGTDVGDNLHCDSQDSGWRSATTMCARWPSLLSRCSSPQTSQMSLDLFWLVLPISRVNSTLPICLINDWREYQCK